MKKRQYIFAALHAFLSVSFMCALIFSNAVHANIVVPKVKPKVEIAQADDHTQDKTPNIMASIGALLDFGQPPLPPRKPLAAAGRKLIKSDVILYKKIFSLQAAGRMSEADEHIKNLSDLRLRGHVYYQRYMHPSAYVSFFEELRRWLSLYSDYPGAKEIYDLAMTKKPAGFSGSIEKPRSMRGITRRQEPMMRAGKDYVSSQSRTSDEMKRVKEFKLTMRSLIKKNRLAEAQEYLKTSALAPLLDHVEHDIILADIARSYMHAGQIDKAYYLSHKSLKRSGVQVPMAGWIAGLTAWKKGKYAQAGRGFEVTARSQNSSSWIASAGAYWAARSYMKAGSVDKVSVWLNRAAKSPRTFYGLIATRALGHDFKFNWASPKFTQDHRQTLIDHKIGARALLLVEAQQTHMADAELLRVKPKTKAMERALLSYAGHAGLPALSLRAGNAFTGPNGVYYDSALYPKGKWKSEKDYKVDPLLVHAIIRQESRFNTYAQSGSGAMGLMQLIPSTASYVDKTRSFDSKAGRYQLTDPRVNLDVGEKYLAYLLKGDNIQDDLVSLLMAYNGGPGNLGKWQRQWSDVSDPLLFIELIPSKETRAYVERVLANYWIYRLREGLDTPTLQALLEGRPALYAEAMRSRRSSEIARLDISK